MAWKLTPLGRLDKAIQGILQEVADGAGVTVREAQVKVARRAVTALKKTSPRDKKPPKGRKHYAENWAFRVWPGRLSASTIIFNRDPTYRVAHLLEKGTGPTDKRPWRAAAREHIRPVAEVVERSYVEEVKRGL